jgi:hypothetical protein
VCERANTMDPSDGEGPAPIPDMGRTDGVEGAISSARNCHRHHVSIGNVVVDCGSAAEDMRRRKSLDESAQ